MVPAGSLVLYFSRGEAFIGLHPRSAPYILFDSLCDLDKQPSRSSQSQELFLVFNSPFPASCDCLRPLPESSSFQDLSVFQLHDSHAHGHRPFS